MNSNKIPICIAEGRTVIPENSKSILKIYFNGDYSSGRTITEDKIFDMLNYIQRARYISGESNFDISVEDARNILDEGALLKQ